MVEEQKGLILAEVEKQALASCDWEKQIELVKNITAKNCSPEEFALLCHMSKVYNLNPLKKEIWAVKYANNPALIFVGRDGLLKIAHSTKKFGSMETTCDVEVQDPNAKVQFKRAISLPVSATCTIWRNDYDKPFKTTVYFDEYNRGMALWKEKPKAMLMKVAEAQCLRRAFEVSGVYIPEEMPPKDSIEVEEGE